jgi:transcriptional regulator with XRE-family HTH domain
MGIAAFDHGIMVKNPKAKQPVEPPEVDDDKLYLGEWLKALGIRPAKVARETGINEGYLSSLISGRKRNPTRSILLRIAKSIGIEWHLLYEPPPPKAVIEQIKKYGTGVLQRLERSGR